MKRCGGPSIVAVVGLLVVTAWCMAQQSPATAPASAQTAREVIDGVVRDVLVVLRNPNVSRADKLTEIRRIADKHVDFETVARLSLGRYWRDLSDAKRGEYVKEFENHLSATHGRVFDKYVDEDVIVVGERQEQRGDYTVQTRILSGQGEGGRKKELSNVDYRLRQKDGRWQIIDVTIDGVSLAANFRAQFQDIMARGGIEELLKLLREKNAAGKQ